MILLGLIAFSLGACVGSFLNVVADRLPEGESIIRPPSHCPSCGHRLSPAELIPLLSYLWLRGRCHRCGARIPIRVLLVESATAAAFLLLYLKSGFTLQWGILAFYFSLFLTIAVIDVEHELILDKLVYPACPVAFALHSVYPMGIGLSFPQSLFNSLLGGAVGFLVLLLPALIWREGMGWGDVKLAGLIGLATGFPGSLVALLLAILSGGVLAAILLLCGFKKRRDHLPFG
ncbi:MAG: prepilin peptidase, partial [Chloroflexi bacterium]